MSQKLELTWYGKDKPINPKPRILIEDDANSNLKKDGSKENLLGHAYNLNIVHPPIYEEDEN